MNRTTVSVVLPCFNHEKFLPERIFSVLGQTRPVDEIIILDDASTDNSVSLARKLVDHAHCPVTILTNTVNSGSPFAQWNKGVGLATGDLVWIAETDDSCDQRLLERLLQALESTKATFAWSQSKVVDENGRFLHSAGVWHESIFPGLFANDFTMEGDIFIRNFLSCVNLIPNASGALFERKRYLEVGPANQAMRYAGDWLQWIKIIQGGKVCFIMEELNHFRCHLGTTRAAPNRRNLSSENLLCMSTALVLSSQHGTIHQPLREYLVVRAACIPWRTGNCILLDKMLSNILLVDVLFLNSRMRGQGGKTRFSFDALLLLSWLALVRWLKVVQIPRPRKIINRLMRYPRPS